MVHNKCECVVVFKVKHTIKTLTTKIFQGLFSHSRYIELPVRFLSMLKAETIGGLNPDVNWPVVIVLLEQNIDTGSV